MDQQKKTSRIHWGAQELELLRELAEKQQIKKWVKISLKINQLNQNIKRTPKQCREKYINYLQFDKISGSTQWTQEQLNILFNQYKQKGPKWKLISFSLPLKSENSIKNKFYGVIRKFVRKLNNISKNDLNKNLKPIQDRSLAKIINLSDSMKTLPASLRDQSRILKQNLFKKVKRGLQGYDDWQQPQKEEIKRIIQDIHSFNSKCRYFCSKNGKVFRFFKTNNSSQQIQIQGSNSSYQNEKKFYQLKLQYPFIKTEQDD